MSKILDGVAWLAASHGSTLEDVVIKVVIIIIINMGCHDRTELWVSSGVQIAIWISIDLRTLNEQVGLSSPWIWSNRNPT